jgi:uncharacterized RDD family membrane protein YckC
MTPTRHPPPPFQGDATRPDPDYYGQRQGLPRTGPGSMASVGRRLGALTIDWAISYGLAYLVVGKKLLVDGQFAALSLLAVAYLIGLAINGATFGMQILGLRVTADDGSKVGLYAIGMRTVLLFLVIPAVVWDQDGRGLHDRIAHTMIVATR